MPIPGAAAHPLPHNWRIKTWLELTGVRVSQEQDTGSHTEIGAVQFNFTTLNAPANERKRHQVAQTLFNNRQLQAFQITLVVTR